MKKLPLFLFFILCISQTMLAQEKENEQPRIFGANKMLITGNAEAQFLMDSSSNNFGELSFKPIFLWSLSDKLFIESQIEIETGGGEPELVLEYVNMCYKISPYAILHFGRFLPKFGMYRGRLGEAFVSRFASDPVGFGDGGIGPMVEQGIGVQGGVPLGSAKMNYDIWVSDGPQLITADESPADAGQFNYEAYTDNNKNKAVGGRIGILPFSNSSLELGFSMENASKTGSTGTDLEGVGTTMMAFDANYFHKITPLKSTIRLLGEYKSQNTDKASYFPEDSAFENKSNAWYGLFSIRPSAVENKFIHNLEFAFRYSQFAPPADAPWGGDANQSAVALDYWLKWNCVAKFTWQKTTDEAGLFIFQLVYGF